MCRRPRRRMGQKASRVQRSLGSLPATAGGAPVEPDHVERAGEAAELDLAEGFGLDALGEPVEVHGRHQHVDVLGVVAQAGGHVDRRTDVVVALEEQRLTGGEAGPELSGAHTSELGARAR